jgi:hypothetical protein
VKRLLLAQVVGRLSLFEYANLRGVKHQLGQQDQDQDGAEHRHRATLFTGQLAGPAR